MSDNLANFIKVRLLVLDRSFTFITFYTIFLFRKQFKVAKFGS